MSSLVEEYNGSVLLFYIFLRFLIVASAMFFFSFEE